MESDRKSTFSHVWPQWLAAVQISCLMIIELMPIGWQPPFLTRFNSENFSYKMTTAEISWIVSLLDIGEALGIFMGSIATTYLGAKRAIYVCGFYLLIGRAILIGTTSKVELGYVGVLFEGFGFGSTLVVNPIYISEISDAKYRVQLMTVVTQSTMIGIFLGNLMGTYLSIQEYAIVSVSFIIFLICTFIYLPETPHHLVRCKKMDEAERSIYWYNRNADTKKELTDLSEFLNSSTSSSHLSMLKTLFTDSVSRNTLFKLSLYAMLYQIGGISATFQYTICVLTDAPITVAKPTTIVSILSFINLPANCVPIYTADRFRRTYAYLTASLIITVSLIGFAVSFHLLDLDIKNESVQWMIIASALIYHVTFIMGLQHQFTIIISELFAPNVKTVGIGIVLFINVLWTFLMNKYFLYLVELFTYKYVFYTFAGIIMAHGIYVKIVIPETKGMTLQEIQKMLNNDKNKPKSDDGTIMNIVKLNDL